MAPDAARQRGGCAAPGGRAPRPATQLDGQLSSISLSASSRFFCPLIQAVIPLQKLPAPTAPGMESEPSNRNTVDSYASFAICLVVLSGYRFRSKVLCGEM